MAWTTPTSRSYNDLITSSIWNTDLVDNLNYLKSKADRRFAMVPLISPFASLTTGTHNKIHINPDLNGANLVDADVAVYTASSSGAPNFQIYNNRHASNVLSTAITIDATEGTSFTAATPPVINASYDDVATGDILQLICQGAGTGTVGADFLITFLLS